MFVSAFTCAYTVYLRRSVKAHLEKSYVEGYIKGQNDLREWVNEHKVVVVETAEVVEEYDEFAPDTTDWSPLIPHSTRVKLQKGIAAANRSMAQRKRLEKDKWDE